MFVLGIKFNCESEDIFQPFLLPPYLTCASVFFYLQSSRKWIYLVCHLFHGTKSCLDCNRINKLNMANEVDALNVDQN